MADAPPAKKPSKNVLYVAGGLSLAVIGYLWWRSRETAAAATAAEPTTTEPVDTGNASTVSTAGALPATFAAWLQSFLSGVTGAKYTPEQAYNDVTSWLSGNCVTASGASAIGQAIEVLGLPPGYGANSPPLTVCAGASNPPATTTTSTTPKAPGTTTTAPALSQSLSALLTTHNETIVSTAYDSVTKTWLYLTNIGGVYTQTESGAAGGTYEGAYTALPTATRNQGANPFSKGKISVNPNGTYSLLDNLGHTYTFGPNTLGAPTTLKTL
jgi:hypothetical protein